MKEASQTKTKPESNPANWVDEYGDSLFRFAFMRLGDRATAEDVVQETFLAALRGIDGFAGESQLSTWLFAILRRKISDHYRRVKASNATEASTSGQSPTSSVSTDFQPLKPWKDDPAKLFEQREFWVVFHECAGKLPETLSEAYVLRDLDGLSPKEICEILDISATNLSMRVFRARRYMRECLDKNWFRNRDQG